MSCRIGIIVFNNLTRIRNNRRVYKSENHGMVPIAIIQNIMAQIDTTLPQIGLAAYSYHNIIIIRILLPLFCSLIGQ